jgi:hypothetical protein
MVIKLGKKTWVKYLAGNCSREAGLHKKDYPEGNMLIGKYARKLIKGIAMFLGPFQ